MGGLSFHDRLFLVLMHASTPLNFSSIYISSATAMRKKYNNSRKKLNMIKLRSAKKLLRSLSNKSSRVESELLSGGGCAGGGKIEWEVRPGGMLVQKREWGKDGEKEIIQVRVSTGGSKWHHISICATSTFGELKVLLSCVTGLEPIEQRLLFKGKEREDGDHLHMVGVKDADKVLLLEDPAIKERKFRALMMTRKQVMGSTCAQAIRV